MTAADIIAALDLPASARVDQRVPKKLLVENGAPTAADKRRINDGIDEVHWVAALKPTTIGVPEFRDTIREYLEIAVLSVVLRAGAQANPVAELIHRAADALLCGILRDSECASYFAQVLALEVAKENCASIRIIERLHFLVELRFNERPIRRR